MARESFEGWGFGEFFEGEGDIVAVFHDLVVTARGAFHFFLQVGHVVVHEGGFDVDEAAEAPVGGGDEFDEFGLLGGGGLVFGVEVGAEGFVGVATVGWEDDDVGEEAVFEGVKRGFLFAFGGGGALGFGSVEAGLFGFGELRHGCTFR